ncbi:MAG: hypothetical protein WA696_06810 [Solirubrobacterales bacterium]
MRANTKKRHNMVKRFAIVIGVAATAAVMALPGSASANTDGHFPEINPPGAATACAAVLGSGAIGSGSETASANKSALLIDACFGG